MTSKKHYLAEKLIIITFPVALFAGCAGSGNIKTASEPHAPMNLEQQGRQQQVQQQVPEQETQHEPADISLAYADPTEDTTHQYNDAITYQAEDTAPYLPYDPDQHHSPTTTTTTTLETPDSDTTIPIKNQHSVLLLSSEASSKVAPEIPPENRLHFETSQYKTNSDQQKHIQQHADYLLANAHLTLTISGHADNRGTQRYNQTLSNQRAQTVYDQLISLGVPATQLTLQAYGERQPWQDPNNWAENRRVEFEYGDAMVLSVAE